MQIDEKTFVVDSLISLTAFCSFVKTLFGKGQYITFTWKIGADRSLDQNALFHVWLTEYAAHLLSKGKKQVTPGELAGMKRHAKGEYYRETGYPFMVHTVINPANQQQFKTDYTSSKSWKQGEMYALMAWLQMKAAEDGLVLESKGEYQRLQREQAA